MEGVLTPAYLLLMVHLGASIAGGVMAANRGRTPLMVLFWSVASALVPFCVLVIYMKAPVREVEGRCRKCHACGEWIKWRENPCHYCNAPQPAP